MVPMTAYATDPLTEGTKLFHAQEAHEIASSIAKTMASTSSRHVNVLRRRDVETWGNWGKIERKHFKTLIERIAHRSGSPSLSRKFRFDPQQQRYALHINLLRLAH